MKILERIKEIREHYCFEVLQHILIPKEIMTNYGYLIQIERVNQNWILLLNGGTVGKKVDTILLCNNNFEEICIIKQYKRIWSFCYSKKLNLIACIQTTDINPFSAPREAFQSKDNVISISSLEGGNDRKFRLMTDNLFYPLRRIIFLADGTLVFFDFANRLLKYMDASGNLKKEISVGNLYLKTLKRTLSDEVFFSTMSKVNLDNMVYDDDKESIYRIVEDKVELVVETEYEGKSNHQSFNSIYDLELIADNIYYASDDAFGKINKDGKTVFKVLFNDHSFFDNTRIIVGLTKDDIDSHNLYMISWDKIIGISIFKVRI